jgi:cyclic di-GMP phosphodiesterase Gmr
MQNNHIESTFGARTLWWQLTSLDLILEVWVKSYDKRLRIPLSSTQAHAIRTLGTTTRSIELDMPAALTSRHFKAMLIGRRTGATQWSGDLCDFHDTATIVATLEESILFAERVLANARSHIVVVDEDARIRRFNEMCQVSTGLTEVEALGTASHALFVVSSELAQSTASFEGRRNVVDDIPVERTMLSVHGERKLIWNRARIDGIMGDKSYWVYSGTDVTAERDAQSQADRQRNEDELTGVLSRFALRKRLATRSDTSSPIALMLVNLDGFKLVNNRFGYEVGDSIIRLAAEMLARACPEAAVFARGSGAEFIVALEDMDAEQHLYRSALRLRRALASPLNTNGIEVYITASCGITAFPGGCSDVDKLLLSADMALHAAQADKAGTIRCFDPALQSAIDERMWLDQNIRRALDMQEFELHYQPKVSLHDGRVLGVEALLRWNHPERGMIGPDQFIPRAEATGLIHLLGKWVLAAAARQAKAWRAEGIELRIAVNISAHQVGDPSLNEFMVTAQSIAGGLLDVELTESALMENDQQSLAFIEHCRSQGYMVYLDDFGTGYSSLSQIANLPLDFIKLDRKFMDFKTGSDNSRGMMLIKTMAAVAGALGINVIAEGVETEEQAAMLLQKDVSQAQGWLYSKALPADDLVAWMAARQPANVLPN